MFKLYQNVFLYKFILVLLIIIININNIQSQSQPYKPKRYTHNTHLTENKLWFFGGLNETFHPTRDVFYVDLTNKFDTDNVQFIQLPPGSSSPFLCSWCQSAMGGKDNSIIYFFAGIMINSITLRNASSTIYSFDIKNRQWSDLNLSGKGPSKRREF